MAWVGKNEITPDEAMDLIKSRTREIGEISANKKQVGGEHYKKLDIQPWEYMEANFTKEEFLGFLRGNVIKYISRNKENNMEDLAKAKHYIEKMIEVGISIDEVNENYQTNYER